jgi:hypothetical protein
MRAEFLHIAKTVVIRILKENLEKRKLCARFVPQSLIPEQREDRVIFCQDIIVMANAYKKFGTKLLRKMRHGVFPMIPKKETEFWLGW